MRRTNNLFRPLGRALLAIVVIYAVLGGATSTGLLTPPYRFMTMGFLAFLALIWLIVRWRQGWKWHQNPVDIAILLWVVVFVFSIATNLDVWRRSVIGLWFALAYIGIWLILQDCLANRPTMRQALIAAVILAGLVVLVIGYDQVVWWFSTWLNGIASGTAPRFEVPRVDANIDNPNFLGGFLAVLLPLCLSQLLLVRSRTARIALAVYVVLAALLLIISDSRGAWIGAGVGLCVFGVLLLARADLLTPSRLRSWWASQNGAIKTFVGVSVTVVVLVVALFSVVILRSLSEPGRTVELRTYLFDVGLKMLAQKPLTGWGLFTAGRGLLHFASTPPLVPHATVHDLPINVAAELGLPGLVVLLLTLALIFIAMRRNWRAATQRERLLLAGAIGGSAAFSVHHLLDSPTTGSPLLVLCCMICLALAVAPLKPVLVSPARGRVILAGVAAMWIVLLGVGFWNTTSYATYVAALRYGAQGGDPLTATVRMQSAIDADPAMPIYYLYRGFFFGDTAQTGNGDATRKAIADYTRFLATEPDYSPAWTNLGTLYSQTGQIDQAVSAIQRAATLAPDDAITQLNLGLAYEKRGDMEESQDSQSQTAVTDHDAARQAYTRALSLSPDAGIDPIWQQTALRKSVLAVADNNISAEASAVNLLKQGDAAGAQGALNKASPADQNTPDYQVIAEVIALRGRDRASALAHLNLARHLSANWQYEPWVQLGISRLAEFDGDQESADAALRLARDLVSQNENSDDNRISAIAYAQYWAVGLQRYFLPQVYLPPTNIVLSTMLDTDIR